jgi:hypothetical protein
MQLFMLRPHVRAHSPSASVITGGRESAARSAYFVWRITNEIYRVGSECLQRPGLDEPAQRGVRVARAEGQQLLQYNSDRHVKR